MSSSFAEDQLSDEEVFFGKITLKEIKKHILWNKHLQNKDTASTDEYNDDIKIIETHSAPDLIHTNNSPSIVRKAISNTSLSPDAPQVYSSWDIKPDDSFLKVEKMLTDMSVSPKKEQKNDGVLNNTLDIIDYILKNGPPKASQNVSPAKPAATDTIPADNTYKREVPQTILTDTETVKNDCKPLISNDNFESNVALHCTPTKTNSILLKKTDKGTPYTDLKQRTPIFKTPGNPLSHKKPSVTSLKKTPSKNNAYQHIASPIASYIKNCPVAPLVKEVRPTKPLPGISSIPKFMKTNSTHNKPSNKENLNLPSIAYRSAKKTQVITVPDEDKLPQSQWIKKITSSVPKPLIMKHDHRETNLAKRVLVTRQEDSFADLSLRQADVSVCTQKSAFNKPKKP
ncbi:hypothetical protein ABMA28_007089 [Loxostege sticticalis]|uniref:Uncharacterized protein n=1 Tax=Loxostege sticticalis TaxID=481309 RepID=A0ABD0TPI0_LOXSC